MSQDFGALHDAVAVLVSALSGTLGTTPVALPVV